MASSYALPQPPLPHSHGQHGQHGHAHHPSHSSSPSFGHSRSSRTSLNGGSMGVSQGHSYTNSHDSSDDEPYAVQARAHKNMSHYRTNSLASNSRRDVRPSPLRHTTEEDEEALSNGHHSSADKAADHKHHGHDHHDHDHDHEHAHDHDHNHTHDHHSHDHSHSHNHDHSHSHHDVHSHDSTYSTFTGLLLPFTARWPLIHAIMTDKDSRRIFYFMGINFSFMGVQATYGYLTDSLGLLSDSIHMFFDCVALAVGLFASVMSKWPPSGRFPYGFGKIETLSGFANGIFLVLISLEILFEGFERLLEGRETKRLSELFIVSTMGLVVNLLGIFAFGSHSHHGHDHGHDHGHGHGHDHGHDHHGHDHSHGHSHDNENLHGIYLHILADTLGSASVIVSTILTWLMPWSGWDPLASLLIAYLILITAWPLVKSSARRLLLTVPEDTEYNLRDTLSEITNQRGVAAYAVPKFWVDDRTGREAKGKLLGVIHVATIRGSDPEDVRERVQALLARQGVELTVQTEREGDSTCWCGMGRLNGMSGKIPVGF